LQLDTNPSNEVHLLVADGNKIVFFDSKSIKSYSPTEFQRKQLIIKANNNKLQYSSEKKFNNLETHNTIEIFEQDDVKYFKKCGNVLAVISQ